MTEDDDEEPCVCADEANPGQHYHCPICDAEWAENIEGDDET